MKKYPKSGVNIKKEQKTVKALIEIFDKEIFLPGIFAKHFYLGETALGLTCDGVGSKILCYQKKGDFHGIAWDLVAMNVNDLSCEFIRPQFLIDYLAFNKPSSKIAKEIGKDLKKACEFAEIKLAGGELASLPDQIKNGTFDWAAVAIGSEKKSLHEILIRRRENLKPGYIILGIPSSGIHSNGLTLARKLYENKLIKPNEIIPGSEKTLIEELTTPTKIYSPLMEKIKDLVEAFVHITGGGYRNLLRVLPQGVFADLRISKKVPIFELIKEKLKVPENEMFEVFNMGYGMVIIIKKENLDKLREIVEKEGEECDEIGVLRKGRRKVSINKKIVFKKY